MNTLGYIAVIFVLVAAFVGVVWYWLRMCVTTKPKPVIDKTDPKYIYLVYRRGLYYVYRVSDELFLHRDGSWGAYAPHRVYSHPTKEILKRELIYEYDLADLVILKKPSGFKPKFD